MKLNNRQIAVCYLSMIEASDQDIRMLLASLKDEHIDKWRKQMDKILPRKNKENLNG